MRLFIIPAIFCSYFNLYNLHENCDGLALLCLSGSFVFWILFTIGEYMHLHKGNDEPLGIFLISLLVQPIYSGYMACISLPPHNSIAKLSCFVYILIFVIWFITFLASVWPSSSGGDGGGTTRITLYDDSGNEIGHIDK